MHRETESTAQEQNFFEFLKTVNELYVRSKSDQYNYDFVSNKPTTSTSLNNIDMDDLLPERKYRLSLSSSGKKRKKFRKMSETSTRERSPRKKLSFDV
jgi:hypothetical protein